MAGRERMEEEGAVVESVDSAPDLRGKGTIVNVQGEVNCVCGFKKTFRDGRHAACRWFEEGT